MTVWLDSAISLEGKLHDGNDVVVLAQDIAKVFPDLAEYCAEARPTTSWCGVFIANRLAKFGIRPPYIKGNDVGSFMYVDAWAKTDWGGTHIQPGNELPGDIIALKVPHHVTFLKEVRGSKYLCVGGNQHDGVTEAEFHNGPEFVMAIIRPPAIGSVPVQQTTFGQPPEIKLGATGPFVIELQNLLGIPATGVFDDLTDAAVRAFQASRGLDVDGEVGEQTWPALKLTRSATSTAGLSQQTINAIVMRARSSDLAKHVWLNGRAPIGYINGMAVVRGLVHKKFKAGDSSAMAIAMHVPANDKDALEWYENKLNAVGLINNLSPLDNIRNTFVLLTGLGMRESSGRYCEGVDRSATNFEADTAEAGLFQQSWNSHTASAEIVKLFKEYSANPIGFLEVFKEGVAVHQNDMENFGSGDGLAFQKLCKSCPAFAVECAAVGLRVLRTHWGPINRHEAEIIHDTDVLFRQVEAIVDAQPIDGDIIPPAKPDDDVTILIIFVIEEGENMDANVKAALLAELNKPNPNLQNIKPVLIQAMGGTPQGPVLINVPAVSPLPMMNFDFTKIGPILASPAVKKILAGQQITITDILPLIPAILALTQGHDSSTVAAALPPVAEPAPVPTTAPVVPPQSNMKFNWSTGIGLAIAALTSSAAGISGSPIPGDPSFTMTGLLTLAAPLAAAAFGIPAPVANGVVSVVTNLFKAAKGQGK